jgi:hypothetical protein
LKEQLTRTHLLPFARHRSNQDASDFGVIWSEKRWIPACFGVKNGLFSRFFLVKSSAFNTVRGKGGRGGGAAFWPSPVGPSMGYYALMMVYFTQENFQALQSSPVERSC